MLDCASHEPAGDEARYRRRRSPQIRILHDMSIALCTELELYRHLRSRAVQQPGRVCAAPAASRGGASRGVYLARQQLHRM
jgi:hypothetical protein